jgi:hypothetical protein
MTHDQHRNIFCIGLLGLSLLACNHATKPKQSKASAIPPPESTSTPHIERNSENGISIEDLKKDEAFSGAGTAFSLASAPQSSNGIIFGYSTDEDATGVRVNNHLYKLKQVSSKVVTKGKGEQGLGERCIESWSGEGIVVEFDYQTTSSGEGGVGYKGRLNIQLGDKKASFKIVGGSGC